jgi:exopolyphosphatase/guanosine-5'-triphosphate,3'-diphosphate pyrophosphatase
LRFAAVDIGSNAVRLLFSEVYEHGKEPVFKKITLIRLPIRLGEDAFLNKKISDERAEKLLQSMEAFQRLKEVYQVVDYRACATSAMREAENGKKIIEKIKASTGITVEIVKGKEEAEIIYANHIAETLDPKEAYLYVDVGGGSTELSIFKKDERIKSVSFNIGTLRIKNKLVKESTWNEMKAWLKAMSEKYSPNVIIGTGGNINRLYKMAGLKDYAPFYYKDLKELSAFINRFTLEEKMRKLGLKPDRADVISPATEIYLTVMKHSNIKEIMVPKLGLADGLIHQLYEKHKRKQKTKKKTT